MKIVKDPHFYVNDDNPNGFNIQVTAKELKKLVDIGELAADKIRAFLQQDPLGQRWLLSGLTDITVYFTRPSDNINLSSSAFDIEIINPSKPKYTDRLIISSTFRKYNKLGRF